MKARCLEIEIGDSFKFSAKRGEHSCSVGTDQFEVRCLSCSWFSARSKYDE
eukprot:COSAG06_NODE_46513_length_346_cov_0.838057_2_plen_50_part_01